MTNEFITKLRINLGPDYNLSIDGPYSNHEYFIDILKNGIHKGIVQVHPIHGFGLSLPPYDFAHKSNEVYKTDDELINRLKEACK